MTPTQILTKGGDTWCEGHVWLASPRCGCSAVHWLGAANSTTTLRPSSQVTDGALVSGENNISCHSPTALSQMNVHHKKWDHSCLAKLITSCRSEETVGWNSGQLPTVKTLITGSRSEEDDRGEDKQLYSRLRWSLGWTRRSTFTCSD